MVVQYIADDGAVFFDQGECVAYEALCAQVAEIMRPLVPQPENFYRGGSYIQQDPTTVRTCRMALIHLMLQHPTLMLAQGPDRLRAALLDFEGAIDSVSYVLSHSDRRVFQVAWDRFQCSDAQGREWCSLWDRNNLCLKEDIPCVNGNNA